MPLAVLLVLPFEGASLVMVCFLRAIDLGNKLFEEGFGLDRGEILSVDSDLNESTNLWWEISH